ncbi:hypothetical protein AHF37_04737 [Paragonimus kellicotti]|nr:hypothetical protein AHF37_04737 [Paragonimus kellicotti]
MLSPHKNGVICIALTGDARYLATLSADEINQKFAIWNWTTGSEIPLCEVNLTGEHVSQNWISFKLGNYYHVVTNSQRQVIFYNWNVNGGIHAYAPPLTDEDFDKKVGNFVSSRYVPESNVAITATTQGLLVVWETDKINIKSTFNFCLKYLLNRLLGKFLAKCKHIFMSITQSTNFEVLSYNNHLYGIVKMHSTRAQRFLRHLLHRGATRHQPDK